MNVWFIQNLGSMLTNKTYNFKAFALQSLLRPQGNTSPSVLLYILKEKATTS